MDSLREDGITKVCSANDDFNESSFNKSTDECVTECALVRCCHSDFRAENTAASTVEFPVQDAPIQDAAEGEGKGNTGSNEQISSLREEVGSNRGCCLNNNCNEGSCGGRSNEFELECGDTTGVSGNVEDGREGSASSVQPTCNVLFLQNNVVNEREGCTSGVRPACDITFLQDIGREGSTSDVQPVCDMSFLHDNGREGSTGSDGQPTCDVSFLQDNVGDGREGSMSGVQQKSHVASSLQENVVDRRDETTGGSVQRRTSDVIHGITLPPWTLTMPKIDKGTQVIKIPCVNEVEGLPLPDDVKHVSAEIATMLLQMVGGLHEVVMETILEAKDKLKEANEESQRKDLEIAELRNALEAYKHAAEYQGSKESNHDNPIEVRNFGGIINLNEANGEEIVVDKGGEVGRQSVNGSDYGSKIYYEQNNLVRKHFILMDADMTDRLPKKTKTNL
ncbi:hypothetical protein G4B88_008969 [Cannabis sativa]|uniref:Uncharacterized protein n=2 Tax=Cannabis sativa TaxID=3483 RepID=A0A7J6HPE4_CANSA|nr:hypothetical protein G4B88_008969 [Cannabis sativa]